MILKPEFLGILLKKKFPPKVQVPDQIQRRACENTWSYQTAIQPVSSMSLATATGRQISSTWHYFSRMFPLYLGECYNLNRWCGNRPEALVQPNHLASPESMPRPPCGSHQPFPPQTQSSSDYRRMQRQFGQYLSAELSPGLSGCQTATFLPGSIRALQMASVNYANSQQDENQMNWELTP